MPFIIILLSLWAYPSHSIGDDTGTRNKLANTAIVGKVEGHIQLSLDMIKTMLLYTSMSSHVPLQ